MTFQTFDDPGGQGDHAARLAQLRSQMAQDGIDAFIVPRADAHQGEYVADADARLAWLTGFTGSAGFAIVTRDQAGVFIDGRYRVQVKEQVDPAHFTPVPWPETRPSNWLRQSMPAGGRVGFDPWLHTRKEIEAMERGLAGSGLGLIAAEHNPVDAIWADRPAPPVGQARPHEIAFSGETAADKRARLAADLRKHGQAAAFLSLPDSISWLLNIRGNDLPKNPVVQGFAVLSDSGHVTLFSDPAKFDDDLRRFLGDEVSILHPDGLTAALLDLTGPVRIDPATAPEAAFRLLERASTRIMPAPDPVIMPKSRKNPAELRGMREAHLADGVAMVRLLAWLDRQPAGTLTEIDVVKQLEEYRRVAGVFDISFDTICGAGPNGAIVHYRVTQGSNRKIGTDDMLLLDSGGQYRNGTTDITRTLPIGSPPAETIAPYTAVLRGMIGLTQARFPVGVTGAHLDALARQYLWQQGMDYDHGTGHGVGAALCVHEGPVRISRASDLALQPGMILSNEPGYYREGSFGIRIENLVIVTEVEAEENRSMLGFETLTLCPIDTRCVDRGAMARHEIGWLDAYHAMVRDALSPYLDPAERDWLDRATRPLRD
ncbi:aminopeptidase P family protein [Paracoccus sp. Z330]|uniref:Aminopeptidase P family protein n=1 Tax=Paracoccus onchidii TaxID=3017813 RepID=A0ABT4ZAY9_9RHOB|nr:aminopeptidase P family protein [Paracoccus onchidii]MDB6176530.1 aminopeptidase P family protein [Paracoccus onchidii]